MMHAPETHGRVYLCVTCQDGVARTISESFRHSEESHPGTVQTCRGPNDCSVTAHDHTSN